MVAVVDAVAGADEADGVWFPVPQPTREMARAAARAPVVRRVKIVCFMRSFLPFPSIPL